MDDLLILRENTVIDYDEILDNEELSEKIEKETYDKIILKLKKRYNDIPIEDILFFYKAYTVKNMIDIQKNKSLFSNGIEHDRSEIYPERWNVLHKNRTEDLLKKKGAHRCPRCKSWFTEHVEIQTRSADESATVKISCECGHRWKLN